MRPKITDLKEFRDIALGISPAPMNQYYLLIPDGKRKKDRICPHCTADVVIKNDGSNKFVITIKHQDSCQWVRVVNNRKLLDNTED